MRVLVTAGGTRVPIDEVRWVGNVSTGSFGAQIVSHCLARGDEVVHLHARDAKLPLQRTVDLTGNWRAQWADWQRWADTASAWVGRYRAVPFTTFQEYADCLESLLCREHFDVVFLVAAVSDYAPHHSEGKISSQQAQLRVHFQRTPKLIAKVRTWAPSVFLVGFKLLVGASREELVSTAKEFGRANRCDVTVANDLRLLQAGSHTIHLVRDGKEPETYATADGPAEKLVERVFHWIGERGADE